MKYKAVIAILVAVFPLISQAEIYMQQDQHGNIIYSDTPHENSKIVDTPTVNFTNSQTSTTSPVSEEVIIPVPLPATTPLPYQTFMIKNPTDQQTFQNQRIIPVEIKIDPALQKGDKIQLFVDKKPWGNPQEKTELEINQLDRGTHQIHAEIIDSKQKSIKQSNVVTIYVHYAQLGTQTSSHESKIKTLYLKVLKIFDLMLRSQ